MSISIKDIVRHAMILDYHSGRAEELKRILKEESGVSPLIIDSAPFKLMDYSLSGASVHSNESNWYFSHHRAITLAKSLNYPYVFVLEDFACPIDNWASELKNVLESIDGSLDAIRLGGYCSHGDNTISSDVVTDEQQLGGHAYIIFKKYYEDYIDIVKNVLAIPDNIVLNVNDKRKGRNVIGVKNNIFKDTRWENTVMYGSDCPRVIYHAWSGKNPLSELRRRALRSSRDNINIPIKFLNLEDIAKLELPEHPFHPAYKYLGNWHKADYVRYYIMNFYGGGYADIKFYSKDNNWSECFDLMDKNKEIEIIGRKERMGGTQKKYNKPDIVNKLLMFCFVIARKHSIFTERCINCIEDFLDDKYEALEKVCKDVSGDTQFTPGYPLAWCDLILTTYHKVCLEEKTRRPYSVSNILNPGWVESAGYR